MSMRIIPAIDIIEGKCVRLKQGDYAKQKVYSDDPLEVAKSFENKGFEYLHLVDLDGAKSGNVVNWNVLDDICNKTSLRVDFGGGIGSKEIVLRAMEAGAEQLNLGSLAVNDPELVLDLLEEFQGKIILSADVKKYQIAINGWKNIPIFPRHPGQQYFYSTGIHICDLSSRILSVKSCYQNEIWSEQTVIQKEMI